MIVTFYSSDAWFEDGDTLYADATYFPFSGDVWIESYEERDRAAKAGGRYLYSCRPLGELRRKDTYSTILSKGIRILDATLKG